MYEELEELALNRFIPCYVGGFHRSLLETSLRRNLKYVLDSLAKETAGKDISGNSEGKKCDHVT